jgi:pilus assembly protein CpaB
MQNRRGLIFLGLALAMGIAAAWVSQRFVSTSSVSGVEIQTTSVVVVRVSVPVATSLSKDQLGVAEWPTEHVPLGALTAADQAVGRVLRRPLAPGEPVLETALFEAGASGGLLAVIAPEHRAVTVKVDNVIGVAGFVTPGARVDVMATLRRVDWKKALPFSQVILQNIRVLAIDQKLEEVKAGNPEVVSVVTLEVDPVQAEHLVYAAHEGRLQLAMRSPGDKALVETRSVGVADVLGEKRVAKSKTRKVSNRVQVINGSQLDTKRF